MGKTASKSATTAGGAPPQPPCVPAKRPRNAPAPTADGNGAAQQPAKNAKDLSNLVATTTKPESQPRDQKLIALKRKLHRDVFEKCLDKKITRETEYWDE
jgi:hypothetical protein